MQFYNEGNKLINSDTEKAKVLYYLSTLYGYKFGYLKLVSSTPNIDTKKHFLTKYSTETYPNEKLLDIVSFWMRIPSKELVNNYYDNVDVTKVWKERFFTKSEKFDLELNEKYSDYHKEFKDFEPLYISDFLGLVILYDQISRNIFRNTSDAYSYDTKAYSLVNKILPCVDKLSPIIQVMIILVLIHQENTEAHVKSKELFKNLKNKIPVEIYSKLREIITNHNMRIELFNRIPERNIILNRKSTDHEKTFMSSV